PVDDYENVNVDPSKSVAELFDKVYKGGSQGFPADHLYWETVLPLVEFEDRQLKSIELHPLTLGFGQPVTERGIPRLAEGELADNILNWMKELSEPFGTTIDVADGVGTVKITG